MTTTRPRLATTVGQIKLERIERQKGKRGLPLESSDLGSLGQGLIKLPSSRAQRLTHRLAEEIIMCQDLPYERKLSDAWVDELREAFLSHTFRPEVCQLITCECRGQVFRINGQHTCLAALAVEQELLPEEPVSVLRYRASNMDVVRRLYSSVDRGRARSSSQVLLAHLGGRDEFDYPSRVLVKLAEGFGYWKFGENARRHGADERSLLMRTDDLQICQRVGDFLTQKGIKADTRHLFRAGVIAAMFVTFSHRVHDSINYWTGVRDGTGAESEHDASLKVRNWLVRNRVGHHALRHGQTGVTTEEIVRVCLRGYLKHRAGEPMRSIRIDRQRPEMPRR